MNICKVCEYEEIDEGLTSCERMQLWDKNRSRFQGKSSRKISRMAWVLGRIIFLVMMNIKMETSGNYETCLWCVTS